MYIKWYDEQRNIDVLVNVDGVDTITYSKNILQVDRGYPSTRYDNEKEGQDRFDDIADALNSGNVIVYDLTKPVKYWKPKVGRKSKTQSQAPDAK